ncbi:hypothetical protein BC936DRAFT_145127 [Jimgerdemannia flammicorona]|uniref:Uncharacterized protein n=1 Tax=Jimgerdemannia flammicorona TaxID=994334 RepID=A0A433DAW3_9FUNG|nr:hypothetical protein BC936DRAFT_145127 [Jimgerdemannia flammicorona]
MNSPISGLQSSNYLIQPLGSCNLLITFSLETFNNPLTSNYSNTPSYSNIPTYAKPTYAKPSQPMPSQPIPSQPMPSQPTPSQPTSATLRPTMKIDEPSFIPETQLSSRAAISKFEQLIVSLYAESCSGLISTTFQIYHIPVKDHAFTSIFVPYTTPKSIHMPNATNN